MENGLGELEEDGLRERGREGDFLKKETSYNVYM